MNIIYTIGIIAAFMAGFLVALICIRIGLKWKIEISQGKAPTLNINPIAPIVDAVQQAKADTAVKYSAEQVKEWMFGDGSAE